MPCALYMNLDMKLPSLGRALSELKLSNLVSGVGRAHASQDGRCFFLPFGQPFVVLGNEFPIAILVPPRKPVTQTLNPKP